MFTKQLIFTTLVLFLSLFNFNTSAGTIDDNQSDDKYVAYGKKHQCVVLFSGIEEKSNKMFFASAVIIKPKIIVTAAHIISEAKEDSSYIVLNDSKIKIIASIYPSGYNENTFASKDIAVACLENEATIDFYPELYDSSDEIGKICSIAGFGITGTHASGIKIHDGYKRAGSNIIDGTIEELLICSVNKGIKTNLEFLIAGGDSGGGLFINKKLAGINSCIMAEDKTLDSNLNDYSGHTRISLYKDWIDSVVEIFERMEK